jgi:hypothetical protein
LFLMFDDSWSMVQCGDSNGVDDQFSGGDPRCTTGPSRWALVSQALIAFVQDPGTAGVGVALRFFPSDSPAAGCDGYPSTSTPGFGGSGAFGFGGTTTSGASGTAGTSSAAGTSNGGISNGGTTGALPASNCDADACAVPLVALGRLTAAAAPEDAQEAALVAAIQASGPPDVAELNPNPQTPTSAALTGATKWASAYQADHPTESTAIVLVTDGEPAGCDTNLTDIARIASDAYSASSVRTFVIGLSGANETSLNQIAVAGGTDAAVFVSDGATVTQDLLARLNAIRQSAMP